MAPTPESEVLISTTNFNEETEISLESKDTNIEIHGPLDQSKRTANWLMARF